MQIRTQVACFVLFLAILLTSSLVQSQVGGGEALPAAPAEQAEADPSAFTTAVSQRFGVPVAQVRALVDAGLPPAEVVVLYFIAQRSLRSADEILADRESGKPWRDIAAASGLGPEQFYYPLPYASRKPFSNVYAVFYEVPRNRWTWDRLQLRDADVESLVSLRFLGEQSGQPAAGVPSPRPNQAVDEAIHHFLLQGQQTASRAAPSPAAVRS